MNGFSGFAAALLLAAGVAAVVSAVTVQVFSRKARRVSRASGYRALTADYVTKSLARGWRFGKKVPGRGTRLG